MSASTLHDGPISLTLLSPVISSTVISANELANCNKRVVCVKGLGATTASPPSSSAIISSRICSYAFFCFVDISTSRRSLSTGGSHGSTRALSILRILGCIAA